MARRKVKKVCGLGKRPRQYAAIAVKRWEKFGRDAAIEFIRSIRPASWRRLVYNHAKIAVTKRHPEWQNTGVLRGSTKTSGR